MSESKAIANRKTIIQNQKTIIADQAAPRANPIANPPHATSLKNQIRILKNQGAFNTVIENQREILARRSQRFAHQSWLIIFAKRRA